MRRILASIATIALLASACTAGLGSAPAARPVTTAAPAATSVVPDAPGQPPPSADAWLVVGQRDADGLDVILASTAEPIVRLATGIPNTTWGWMVSAMVVGTKTRIIQSVQPGEGGPQVVVDGAWRLPTIGYDPVPVGVSADEMTYVLVDAREVRDRHAKTTRFLVLKRPYPGVIEGATARTIELTGSFEYDALSPDGTTLYVVEHLTAAPGGRYQVRAVDVATGSLGDGIIADKRNISEPMAGWPISQIRRDDGGVFTLYRGDEHPFIHALDTVRGTAVCIDLPATGADDAEAARDWGLAPSPDGRSIYAVNATLGLVLDVDPMQLGIRRSVSVEPLASGPKIVLAKFGHQDGGPVGRRVVIGPDGRTIYAAGAGGLVAIGTADLKEAGRYLAGKAVEALGVTPDGSTLYALLRDGGRIVSLDAASGRILGTVPGGGYDRLVAVVPW